MGFLGIRFVFVRFWGIVFNVLGLLVDISLGGIRGDCLEFWGKCWDFDQMLGKCKC